MEINLEDYQQIEECYTVNSFLSKTNYYHNVNNVTTKQPTLYYLNRKVGNNINKNAKLSIDQRELHSYDKHIYYDIHEQRNLKWYEKYSIITDDNDPNKDLKNYYKQLEEPCCCKLFFINRKKLISESSGNFGSDSDNSSHDDDDGDINTYSDSNSSSKSESSRERRQKNQKSNKDDSQEQGGDHKISREGGDLSNLQNKTKILENDINKFVKDNNSRKCDYIVSIDNYNCPCNSIFCLLPHLLRYQINDQVLPTFGEKAITTKRKQRTETVESTTKSVTKTEEEITAEMFATLDELWKDEKLSSERKINNHIFDTYKQIN